MPTDAPPPAPAAALTDEPQRPSGRLLLWAVVSALAGFLFGFDTVVVSGAERAIEAQWSLSKTQHGLAMSSALWATVVGSLVGSWPTDRLGRKPTLLAIGVLYAVSAVWSSLSSGWVELAIARAIGGFGVGVATVAAPLFISEIAPAAWRGRLAGLFQFNIVFGILAAFLSNYLIDRSLGTLGADGELIPDASAWRWMLGVEAVPALLYTLLAIVLPESPRWLIANRDRVPQGRSILRQINPTASEPELDAMVTAIQADAAPEVAAASPTSPAPATPPRSPLFGKRVALAFVIAMFNQLSGINVVLYYSRRIFELAGAEGPEAALLSSVGLGVVNFFATIAGVALIDRLGRRSLLLIGSVGYILSLAACAIGFSSDQFAVVQYSLFAFIAAHAVGQGAVIWVFISEIFPTRTRALGQSIGSGTHWVFAALLTFLTPRVLSAEASPAPVFWGFAAFMVLQLVWVLLLVPETKGVPLEEIDRRLGGEPHRSPTGSGENPDGEAG